jgi:large conductance mechanosensitive channel
MALAELTALPVTHPASRYKGASMFKEFVSFLKQYGVIGLAIAVIIGGKLNEFVSSVVNDLLMPLAFQPALQAAQVDDIRKLSYHGILYGKVVGSAVDFLIVALVVFLIAKYALREETVAKR